MASLENYSTLSNVSVFMRAGSRYETYDTQGLTHLLRRCAFLVSMLEPLNKGLSDTFFMLGYYYREKLSITSVNLSFHPQGRMLSLKGERRK